jgi:hypothetical protein
VLLNVLYLLHSGMAQKETESADSKASLTGGENSLVDGVEETHRRVEETMPEKKGYFTNNEALNYFYRMQGSLGDKVVDRFEHRFAQADETQRLVYDRTGVSIYAKVEQEFLGLRLNPEMLSFLKYWIASGVSPSLRQRQIDAAIVSQCENYKRKWGVSGGRQAFGFEPDLSFLNTKDILEIMEASVHSHSINIRRLFGK